MISGIKNKIVTSVYDLNYIDERGGALYKSFDLLTITIRNIIFPNFEYVIYTDKKTYENHNLSTVFNQPNVQIKFHELNGDFYTKIVNPLKLKKSSLGNIWDRIHSVNNYVEVMYNKFEFLLNESKNFEGNVVWIDAGLFGTSCGNPWRDFMVETCHTELFVEKIFEKIDSHGIISLIGNSIVMNYEDKMRINDLFNVNCLIIPGGLFGGKSHLILDCFHSYKNIIQEMVDNDFYTSDQEILYITISKQSNKMFFEHDDWDDLQKGILKIMDLYDESKYLKSSCVNYKTEYNELLSNKYNNLTFNSYTELSDILGMDKGSLHENHLYTEIYEEYLNKFTETKLTMIEIGIADQRFPGMCLHFWDIIFSNLNYFGIDIVDTSNLIYNKEKITLVNCDQNNKDQLNSFIETYSLDNNIDVIIDDGSHESNNIITSFTTLYPYIKSGGYYFIEDLHAGLALRDITTKTIEEYLEKNYTNQYKIDYFGYKLMLITKL